MSEYGQGPWERLERFLKDVWFGDVFDLHVVNGVPQLDAPIKWNESRVFAAKEEQRQPGESSSLSDARFKSLIAMCKSRGTFVISKLEVHAGLPRRWEVRRDCQVP